MTKLCFQNSRGTFLIILSDNSDFFLQPFLWHYFIVYPKYRMCTIRSNLPIFSLCTVLLTIGNNLNSTDFLLVHGIRIANPIMSYRFSPFDCYYLGVDTWKGCRETLFKFSAYLKAVQIFQVTKSFPELCFEEATFYILLNRQCFEW